MKFKALKFILLFCLLVTCVEGTYIKSPHIDDEAWASVTPYLLPEDHPIKSKLDSIFLRRRATSSFETLLESHFTWLKQRRLSNVIVARHSKLKGYIIKIYLDDQIGIDEKAQFIKRIRGAQAVREAINAFGYQDHFKVPEKWIYPLPDYPEALPHLQRKNFILVVEDMDLVDPEKNAKMWRSNKSMTREKLKGIYDVLNYVGLFDSVYISNIPFTKDKKIAFIDTEHHSKWPVQFGKLTPHLNAGMRLYWNQITKEE